MDGWISSRVFLFYTICPFLNLFLIYLSIPGFLEVNTVHQPYVCAPFKAPHPLNQLAVTYIMSHNVAMDVDFNWAERSCEVNRISFIHTKAPCERVWLLILSTSSSLCPDPPSTLQTGEEARCSLVCEASTSCWPTTSKFSTMAVSAAPVCLHHLMANQDTHTSTYTHKHAHTQICSCCQGI